MATASNSRTTTLCKSVFTPIWTIRGFSVFDEGHIQAFEMPNFFNCPAGKWTISVLLKKQQSARNSSYPSLYFSIECTLSGLHLTKETIRPPASIKAYLLSGIDDPIANMAAITLNASSGNVYMCDLISVSSFKQQQQQLVVNDTFKISFEITQINAENSYGDTASDEPGKGSVQNGAFGFLQFYNRKELTDFKILVGKSHFDVHKLILAQASPVFAGMFNSGMKESQENAVSLTEFSAEVVEEFIFFLYCGKPSKARTMASELLILANKYQVDSLISVCQELLIEQLQPSTTIQFLELADLHNAKQLKTAATNYIVANFKLVVGTPSWIELLSKNAKLANQVLQLLGCTMAPWPKWMLDEVLD